MSVAELIALLGTLPPDAPVVYPDGWGLAPVKVAERNMEHGTLVIELCGQDR